MGKEKEELHRRAKDLCERWSKAAKKHLPDGDYQLLLLVTQLLEQDVLSACGHEDLREVTVHEDSFLADLTKQRRISGCGECVHDTTKLCPFLHNYFLNTGVITEAPPDGSTNEDDTAGPRDVEMVDATAATTAPAQLEASASGLCDVDMAAPAAAAPLDPATEGLFAGLFGRSPDAAAAPSGRDH